MLSALLLLTLVASAGVPELCPAALERGTRATASGEWFAPIELDAQALDTSPKGLASLRAVLGALAARGILVVGLPTPDRTLVAPDAMLLQPGDTWDPKAAERAYKGLVAAFAASGVGVDLLDTARATPDYFFQRDPHLTPAGMQASAAVVAAAVRATPAAEGLPSATWAVRAGPDAVSDNVSGSVNKLCGTAVPPERFRSPLIDRTDLKQRDEALFGDHYADVVLLGTSQSEPRLNFGGYLAAALETPVDIVAVSDGGPYGALLTYLESDTWRAHTPRVLLWEFPLWSAAPQRPGAVGSRPALIDPALPRRTVPLIQGRCEGAPVVGRLPAGTRSADLYLMPERAVSAIELRFAKPVTVPVSAELYRADGAVERLNFASWRRVPARQRLTWSLAPGAPLARAIVRVDTVALVDAELYACP